VYMLAIKNNSYKIHLKAPKKTSATAFNSYS